MPTGTDQTDHQLGQLPQCERLAVADIEKLIGHAGCFVQSVHRQAQGIGHVFGMDKIASVVAASEQYDLFVAECMVHKIAHGVQLVASLAHNQRWTHNDRANAVVQTVVTNRELGRRLADRVRVAGSKRGRLIHGIRR